MQPNPESIAQINPDDVRLALVRAKATLAVEQLEDVPTWDAAVRAELAQIENAAARKARPGGPMAGRAGDSRTGSILSPSSLPATELYYERLQRIIGRGAPCVDAIEPSKLRPGSIVDIWGTSFGTDPGRVPFSLIAGDYACDLTIHQWSETHIHAELPEITGVGVTTAQIGIVEANGEAALGIGGLLFEPSYDVYLMQVEGAYSGGALGRSYDDTLYPGGILHYEYAITHVGVSYSGGGWAELREPAACGQSLAQGYHVGVRAFRTVRVRFDYQIIGPRGLALPDTPQPLSYVGPWPW